MEMIILAAGLGTRLSPITDDRPKCLAPLHGRPLLEWQIAAARACGLDDIVVVGGYMQDKLRPYDVRIASNPRYRETNMVYTLDCGLKDIEQEIVVAYGDIVYEPRVLLTLLQSKASIAVAVDSGWRGYWEARMTDPLSDAESLKLARDGRIVSIGQKPEKIEDIEAQYIGLMKFTPKGVANVTEAIRAIRHADRYRFETMYMTDLLQHMIDAGTVVRPAVSARGWFEIDTVDDLKLAQENSYRQGDRLVMEM